MNSEFQNVAVFNSRLEPLAPEPPGPPELGLHEVESDVNRIERNRTTDFLCHMDYKAFPPVSFITFFRVYIYTATLTRGYGDIF